MTTMAKLTSLDINMELAEGAIMVQAYMTESLNKVWNVGMVGPYTREVIIT